MDPNLPHSPPRSSECPKSAESPDFPQYPSQSPHSPASTPHPPPVPPAPRRSDNHLLAIICIGVAAVAMIGLLLSAVSSVSSSGSPSGPSPLPVNTASQSYMQGNNRGMMAYAMHGSTPYADDAARTQCQAALGHDPATQDEADWAGGCIAGMKGHW